MRLRDVPNQDRKAERLELADARHRLKVLLEGLAEADPGIEDHMIVWNSGLARDGERTSEEGLHVLDDVPRRIDVGSVVHDDDGRAMSRGDGGDVRLALEAPDVVDDARARAERRLGRPCLVGVDRDRRGAFACGETLDHRKHAGDFFIGANLRGAGPCRLATDVENVRALGDHDPGMGEGGLHRGVAPAVGEAVGRDVEDAHHQRTLAEVGQEGKDHGLARVRMWSL